MHVDAPRELATALCGQVVEVLVERALKHSLKGQLAAAELVRSPRRGGVLPTMRRRSLPVLAGSP